MVRNDFANENMTPDLLIEGIKKFEGLLEARRQIMDKLVSGNSDATQSCHHQLGEINSGLAEGGVAIYQAALMLHLPSRPANVLHIVMKLGEDDEEKYISEALDELLQLRIEANTMRLHFSQMDSAETEVTLLQFMQRYCEKQKLTLLRYRRKSLNDAHSRNAITLPKPAREWKSGQSKYYKANDLIGKWSSYCEILPNLPPLKQ